MSDYECPSCGGGFPTADADDDACPWCGEAMSRGDGGDSHPFISPEPLPGTSPPDSVGKFLEGIGDGEPVIPLRRTRRPITPHWDSGIRVETAVGATSTSDGRRSMSDSLGDNGNRRSMSERLRGDSP